MKILALKLLAGLAITVAISIGPLVAALSVDTKGKVKGDIGWQTGSYKRGKSYCLRNCDSNYSDGTGNYIGHTAGNIIQTQTRVYEDGATSVDTSVSAELCGENRIFCGKVAVSKRLADNFDKKEDFTPHNGLLNGSSLRSTEISPSLLSSPEINGQSTPLRPVVGRTRPSNPLFDAAALISATQSKRNEGTKKLGKQIYNQVKAVDPILIAASKISRP